MIKQFLTILFPSLLLLSACGSKKAQAPVKEEKRPANSITLTPAQISAAHIRTGLPELRPLSRTIRANGRIDVPPQNMISVSIPLGGYLRSTQLLPGMHVLKGMTIAILEDQQYIQLQQDYLTTQAKLEMAEAEYNRQRELNASKAASDKVLEQAKAEFRSLRITQSALAEKLRLININPQTLSERNLTRSIRLYAPSDGYVSKVNVNIGKYVTASDVLFEIVNPEDIHLNLQLFERDLAQLSIGQKLEAYTNAHPEKRYRCEIILISKDITESRTAEVHCHFEKYDKSLLPGMYMNAEITLQKRDVLCVPEQAVVAFEGKNYVFLATSGNSFTMQEIETGDTEGGWIELRNAEAIQNKTLALEGAYSLLMSLKNSGEE